MCISVKHFPGKEIQAFSSRKDFFNVEAALFLHRKAAQNSLLSVSVLNRAGNLGLLETGPTNSVNSNRTSSIKARLLSSARGKVWPSTWQSNAPVKRAHQSCGRSSRCSLPTSNASLVQADSNCVAHLGQRTNSSLPPQSKTSANWPRSSLYRSKCAKPDRKAAHAVFEHHFLSTQHVVFPQNSDKSEFRGIGRERRQQIPEQPLNAN